MKLVFFLPSFHQSIHILRNLVIGYFGICLCSFDISMSHHFTDTFNSDTSSTLWELPAEKAREMVLTHGVGKFLFGSDYPAATPAQAISDVLKLGLSDADNEKIFHLNAERLLDL